MRQFIFSILIGTAIYLHPATTRADQASHRQAAESLLSNMDMDAVLNQSIDQMLQIQIKANPGIAAYEQDMKGFLKKYMSWAGLKDDMVKLYVDAFTESELNDLNKFYQTPLGKKTMRMMPGLMASGAEIGQRRVQEHLPELEAIITGKEKGKDKGKTP